MESYNKITKAKELLLSDDIESADFRAVRIEAEREIQVLERKISELRTNYMSAGEVEKVLDTALDKSCKLDALYCHSDHYAKRKLIGSIYPEKFTFEELKGRTAKEGEIFKFIYLINKNLSGNKKGTNEDVFRLSQEVIPLGTKPRYFLR